jgi:hypothetical protein
VEVELVVLKGRCSPKQYSFLFAVEVEFLENGVELMGAELYQQIFGLRLLFEFGGDHCDYKVKGGQIRKTAIIDY